jgi:DNA polymerase-3 subunit delta'
MNVDADWAPQFASLRRSYEAGRLAHAYIIVGPPAGAAAAFAEALLVLLLAGDDAAAPVARRIAQRVHPDVVRVEPKSKSRVIRVEEMRKLTQRIQQTASEGDWKVGIISYADRMNEQASNAFLKTLEEPAGQTLLLLLTEAPFALLPTVRSRCQQVVLAGADRLDRKWMEKLLPVLREFGGADPMQVLIASERMQALLNEMKTTIEGEIDQQDGESEENYAARVQSSLLEVRGKVMAAMMEWQRDILYAVVGDDEPGQRHYPDEAEMIAAQSTGLSVGVVLARIVAIEEMARRLARLMPPTLTFDAGFGHYLKRKS